MKVLRVVHGKEPREEVLIENFDVILLQTTPRERERDVSHITVCALHAQINRSINKNVWAHFKTINFIVLFRKVTCTCTNNIYKTFAIDKARPHMLQVGVAYHIRLSL